MNKIYASLIFLSSVIGYSAQTDEKYFKDNGGMTLIKGKGRVTLIDCRPTQSMCDFRESMAKLRDTFNIDIRHVKGITFTLQNAKQQLLATESNVAVFIVDDPLYPMTLSTSEDNWALVNIAQIKKDNPSPEKLKRRTNILLVRQCCRALGSDETKALDCCFRTIQKASDIDSIKSLDVTINPYLSISEVLNLRGIEPFEYGTYRDACEAGVAKPPTNQLQKAIWQEVHQLPTKPIKILPESQRKKK